MYEVVTLGGKHIIRLSTCHHRRCHISQTKKHKPKKILKAWMPRKQKPPTPTGPKKTKQQQDLSLSCLSLHKKKTISILSSSLSPHQKKKKGETNPTRGSKKKNKKQKTSPPPPRRFFFLPNKQLATKPSHTFFLPHFPFFPSLSLLLLLSCCESPLHLRPLLRHSLTISSSLLLLLCLLLFARKIAFGSHGEFAGVAIGSFFGLK